MPARILAAHSERFAPLARAWLEAGASAFGVQIGGTVVASWPPSAKLEPASFVAPIYLGKAVVGELRVVGPIPAALDAHLRAEAFLMSQWLSLEKDLNQMTAELIDTQDQLLALYDLTHATRNYLDIEQILRRFAYETTRLANVEGAYALLKMPNRLRLLQQYPAPSLGDDWIESYFEQVRKSGQPLMLDQHSGSELPDSIRNVFVLPVHIRGVIVAALGLYNKQGGDFTSPDMKLVQAIAEHAGARIENVLLYQDNLAQTRLQTEMELAHRVQSNLLPQRPPAIDGLDLWAGSRPASEVGGDFYDFIAKPGRPFTFTVGDVSGKGMPAALLMAMTRAVTRNTSNGTPVPTPGMVIGFANQDMYDDFNDVSMFATVFVGQYDAGRQEFLYANAGHSPVIYCPAGGKAHLLEADGTALGIFPESLSQDQILHFERGDLLVVGTDGLNEARNAHDEMFGYDRLVDLVESVADLPAQEIGDYLYSTVQDFSGGQPQDDDQTLVVIKATADQ
jgi:phosphoserine phosphatase RsbU/P